MKKTLLIDGLNLLKIGFHGVKEFYHNEKHIGGIWHFLNTTRKLIEERNFDKVIVFWDGKDNAILRKRIYPQYKENRHHDGNELKQESFNYQRQRVKQYLEEMFIRQIEVDENEADDLISYYCKISTDEDKVILTGDLDLYQLISERTSIFSPKEKVLYKNGDKIPLKDNKIPHENIKLYKILSGDRSDNIEGIYYLGEKKIIKLFPEILDDVVSISDILQKAEKLLLEDKENNLLKNLLSGRTKNGIFGNEFFEINERIVDLNNPMITDEGKEVVEMYYKESLDPDGRGYKNLIKMMMEDGIFKYLPKSDNAWVYFLTPFLKLTRKEKKNFNLKK